MNVVKQQKGQTLVWVALGLMGLILILALGIDFGLVWTERRHMQNAADAGALAGARELCWGGGETAARQKAWEYAVTRNHSRFAQEATITVSSNKVTVLTVERVEVFFGGIIGIPIVTVSADATAACGSVRTACGLWPVAFSRQRWFQLIEASRCNHEFYVWDDEQIVDCESYDCDLNDDGHNDIVVGGDRGWLDLSEAVGPYVNECTQPGCGANELACLIRSNSGAKIDLPVCISGDSGVKAGVQNAVQSRAGDTVAVPLFESIGCGNPKGNCPGGLRYWVTAIGCIKVVRWEQHLRLEPIEEGTGKVPEPRTKDKKPTPTSTIEPPPQDTPTPEPTETPTPTRTKKAPIIGKAIVAIMDCSNSCVSACGGTNGDPGNSWEARAVSLIE